MIQNELLVPGIVFSMLIILVCIGIICNNISSNMDKNREFELKKICIERGIKIEGEK